MARKQSVTDWDKPGRVTNDEYETVATSGFNPNWIPENEGETVDLLPVGFRVIEGKIIKKKKQNDTLCMDCIYMGGNSPSFYTGRKKAKQVEMENGDLFSIVISYNLMGENRLAVLEDDEDMHSARVSSLLNLCNDNKKPVRVVFGGKVSIEGGRTVKQFTILAPKGYKEQIQDAMLDYEKKKEKSK